MRYGLPSDEEVRRKPISVPFILSFIATLRTCLLTAHPSAYIESTAVSMFVALVAVVYIAPTLTAAATNNAAPWVLFDMGFPVLAVRYRRYARHLAPRIHAFAWVTWLLACCITSSTVYHWLLAAASFAGIIVLGLLTAAAMADIFDRHSGSDLIDDDFSLLPNWRMTMGWRIRDIEDACGAWWQGESSSTFADAFGSKAIYAIDNAYVIHGDSFMNNHVDRLVKRTKALAEGKRDTRPSRIEPVFEKGASKATPAVFVPRRSILVKGYAKAILGCVTIADCMVAIATLAAAVFAKILVQASLIAAFGVLVAFMLVSTLAVLALQYEVAVFLWVMVLTFDLALSAVYCLVFGVKVTCSTIKHVATPPLIATKNVIIRFSTFCATCFVSACVAVARACIVAKQGVVATGLWTKAQLAMTPARISSTCYAVKHFSIMSLAGSYCGLVSLVMAARRFFTPSAATMSALELDSILVRTATSDFIEDINSVHSMLISAAELVSTWIVNIILAISYAISGTCRTVNNGCQMITECCSPVVHRDSLFVQSALDQFVEDWSTLFSFAYRHIAATASFSILAAKVFYEDFAGVINAFLDVCKFIATPSNDTVESLHRDGQWVRDALDNSTEDYLAILCLIGWCLYAVGHFVKVFGTSACRLASETVQILARPFVFIGSLLLPIVLATGNIVLNIASRLPGVIAEHVEALMLCVIIIGQLTRHATKTICRAFVRLYLFAFVDTSLRVLILVASGANLIVKGAQRTDFDFAVTAVHALVYLSGDLVKALRYRQGTGQ